ncbi:glycoside hydrolase family 20 zincin-like fold domain-containing protein [Bacteroides uniformis]|nr:glycoside hydrolase family 20 zincin-like fold domain-containing protein [Bacteroides uniformis]
MAGADERGAYYGVQTLAQLLALDKLPLAEVTDYRCSLSGCGRRFLRCSLESGRRVYASLIFMVGTK